MTFQMVFRGFLFKPRSLDKLNFRVTFRVPAGCRVNGSSTEFYKGFG